MRKTLVSFMMNLCCTEIFHDNLAIRCFNHLRSKLPLWCLQSLCLTLGYQNMSFLFLFNWSPMTLTIHDDSDPFQSLIIFYFFQKRPFCPSPKYMVRFDSLDFRGLTTQLCSTCMKIKQNTIRTGLSDLQTTRISGSCCLWHFLLENHKLTTYCCGVNKARWDHRS